MLHRQSRFNLSCNFGDGWCLTLWKTLVNQLSVCSMPGQWVPTSWGNHKCCGFLNLFYFFTSWAQLSNSGHFFCPKGGLNGSPDLVHAPHICFGSSFAHLLKKMHLDKLGVVWTTSPNSEFKFYLMDSEMVTRVWHPDKAAVHWFYFMVNVVFYCQGGFSLSLIVFWSVYLFIFSSFYDLFYLFPAVFMFLVYQYQFSSLELTILIDFYLPLLNPHWYSSEQT